MFKSLGIRAHDYGKLKSCELAQQIKKDGLGSAHLALSKAIVGIDDISGLIEEAILQQINKDFKASEVTIAVLGCYLNYAHPDEKIRKNNLDVFKKHIDYGKVINAKVVGTETGSMNGDYSFTPNNHSEEAYKIFASSLYELLQVAEDQQVDIAVEGVWDHIIYSNEQMHRLISDMGSNRLKVILDPVNLLNSENHAQHNDIVKQSFQLFGDRIAVVHAKDYRVEGDKIIEISHGEGTYDYEFLKSIITSSTIDIDVILENAKVSNIEAIKALF